MRLAKFLAHAGVASRRKAEEIIAKGLVTVGGEVVTDPARDVGEGDDVRVNGAPVGAEAREVWAVNKPAGVVSTAREPGSRPAVVELIVALSRLAIDRPELVEIDLNPVIATAGGALANRLTHPRYEVSKTYRVQLREAISDRDLDRLCKGVELEDGPTGTAKVKRLGKREIEITLREGRNRQVRRMLEAVGNRVTSLRRVSFGPLNLGDLPEGKARRLSDGEVAELRDASR